MKTPTNSENNTMMKQFKLILGDCREEIPKLIEQGIKVDMVLTSPPYDNLRTYEELEWDFNVFKEVANQLKEILTDGGVIVWIVNDATIDGSETGTSFKQALYFKEIGLNIHDTMIYKKKGMSFPEEVRYYPCFEYMFILSKGKPKTFNPIADKRNKNYGQKVTSHERNPDGSFRKKNGAMYGRKIKKYSVRPNIWEYATGKGNSSKNPLAFEHPAVMPEQLAIDHILSWSNEEDIILDCFMGGGTTGVACRETNRNFIGIEKVPKYFEISEKRIDTKQSKLM